MKLRYAPAAGLALALGLASTGSARADEPQTAAGKRMAEVFADLDVNHDGILDQSEIDASTKPAFTKLLAKGDANKDGKIDSKEFGVLAEKVVAARKDKAKKPNEVVSKPAVEPVKAAGEVAKPEAEKPSALAPALGAPRERLKVLLEKFKTNDADKDGRLSREEFKGNPAAFDRLDADHDGHLDKSDLKALRARQKAEPAAKAVKKTKRAVGGKAVKKARKTGGE